MPMLASSQMFKVNGHELYLNCQGKLSNLTVVLLAGGGGSTDTWDKVQTPISSSHACVAMTGKVWERAILSKMELHNPWSK